MNDIKLITYGRLSGDFYTEAGERFSERKIEIQHFDKVDQKTLNKYNALAAFSVPVGMNISHILWIHSFGAGVDGFIKRNDLNKNVKISRTVGKLGRKMAEYCLCHILAREQKLYELYKQQKSGLWNQRIPGQLSKMKVAVLGTGSMGIEVAGLLKSVGVEVLGVNTDGRDVIHFSRTYPSDRFIADPEDVDVIICALPYTVGNDSLLDVGFFSNFRNIHFINVGRSGIVDEKTIIDSINNGYISRATLDVFSSEPLPVSSELWSNDSIYITPHQAAVTDVGDIIDSFEKAFESLKRDRESRLFVNRLKGY